MKILSIVLIISTCLISCNNMNDSSNLTNSDSANTKKDTVQYGPMKSYWMVFLYRGPNRKHDSTSAAEIQKAHIANIDRLAGEGKIIMAGPMGDQTDLRGVFIMDCKDSLEAVNLVQSDTAIKTGRLRFEIHPWWTATGTYKFK